TKLPQPLQDIINDEEKRKKLVIYINPPYAEAGNRRTIAGTGNHKEGAARTKIHDLYLTELGKARHELFAQFLIRIYKQIPACRIANFSKLKNLLSSNFSHFRQVFQASLNKIFIVPSNTFDNVRGQFPISFQVWNTQMQHPLNVPIEIYDNNGNFVGKKRVHVVTDIGELINSWIKKVVRQRDGKIGEIGIARNDIQNKALVYIGITADRGLEISYKTLIIDCIYFSVQTSIVATWLNDRDQFLYPKDGWQNDSEFQTNCLAFTLFHGQNRITTAEGKNHWIPFTEDEIGVRKEFESHFMTDFILGKLGNSNNTAAREQHAAKINVEVSPPQSSSKTSLFSEENKTSFIPTEPLVFSPEATAVFDAGRELWRYYHAQPNANPNASYYDIRAHFQGRNEKGKMNPKSEDKEYMRLLGNLKEAMEVLRLKIVPKVYEYGFLIE
ncbi:MAG: hypothetical protein ACTTKZ_05095, partial [Bacteroides sp.]